MVEVGIIPPLFEEIEEGEVEVGREEGRPNISFISLLKSGAEELLEGKEGFSISATAAVAKPIKDDIFFFVLPDQQIFSKNFL